VSDCNATKGEFQVEYIQHYRLGELIYTEEDIMFLYSYYMYPRDSFHNSPGLCRILDVGGLVVPGRKIPCQKTNQIERFKFCVLTSRSMALCDATVRARRKPHCTRD